MWQERTTGLYYARARDYDPRTGLFLSRDPAVPDPTRPESSRPYTFANDNPYLYRDPTGRTATAEEGEIEALISALVRSKPQEIAGSFVTRALETALNLFGVPDPFGGGKAARADGQALERFIQDGLCGILHGKSTGALASMLHFEPAVLPSTGEPHTDGFHCPPEGGKRIGYKRGDVFPDIIFSSAPLVETKNHAAYVANKSAKSYLVAEVKLAVKTAYNKWTKNPNQMNGMIHHAAGYQYVRVAALLTFFGDSSAGNAYSNWIKKQFFDGGVFIDISSLKK